MLHRLRPPTPEVENNLLALVERQHQLLAFARDHTHLNQNTLRLRLGEPFGGWIIRHNDLYAALETLIACAATDKRRVLTDFVHDQEFWVKLDDAAFQFAFSPSKTTAHDYAGQCLNAFYALINSSAPLLPTPQQFKREDIVAGYIATNPFLKQICPCCDGGWPELAGKGKTPYTLEHFFHKEEHPTICVHPYNLIPICDVCNSRRGNKEALESASGVQIGIHQIFYPLYRPAKECVELQYYSRSLEPERLRFVSLPTQADDWPEAVDAYGYLYEIPERWRTQWDEIDGVIGMQLRAALYVHQNTQQKPVSQIDFEHMVSGIVSSLGEYGRYHYPARRWLVWAKQYRLESLYEAHVEARGLHR